MAAANTVTLHAATGLNATNVIAQVQESVRRRLLCVFVRRGLLTADDARAMGQWEHGGGFSVDAWVRSKAADRAGRERPFPLWPRVRRRLATRLVQGIPGGLARRTRPSKLVYPSAQAT